MFMAVGRLFCGLQLLLELLDLLCLGLSFLFMALGRLFGSGQLLLEVLDLVRISLRFLFMALGRRLGLREGLIKFLLPGIGILFMALGRLFCGLQLLCEVLNLLGIAIGVRLCISKGLTKLYVFIV